MLWSIFKVLSIFSSDHPRLLGLSSLPHVSPDAKVSAPTTSVITLTRPDLEHWKDSPKPWLCPCGYQQLDFCPYCDYDQTRQPQDSFVPESPTLDFEASIMTSTHYHFLNSPPRPRTRKLRKIPPDYMQSRLGVECLVSAPPDCVPSIHSRTPLLNRALPSNPNYPPLPVDCRNLKKLEKRENRKRSLSMSDRSRSHSTSLSSSSSDRVVRSKSYLQVCYLMNEVFRFH
jgi:hypothetical protein